MTYPPPGGTPDPYQPQQPYGQPYDPNNPYPSSGAPASGQPYSGQPYSGQPQYGQPDYGQQAYQQPAYGGHHGYAPAAPTNTMAILSLVFAFIFAPLGIVFGHIAKKQIRETREQGDGLAVAGLWVSYIITGLYVIGCIAYLAAIGFIFGTAATTGGTY